MEELITIDEAFIRLFNLLKPRIPEDALDQFSECYEKALDSIGNWPRFAE